jgi:hypothetical protein
MKTIELNIEQCGSYSIIGTFIREMLDKRYDEDMYKLVIHIQNVVPGIDVEEELDMFKKMIEDEDLCIDEDTIQVIIHDKSA